MAQFDRFVQTIYKFRADHLTVESGERVTLCFGAERRPVSAEAATRQQVEGLLKEIVPPNLASTVAQEGTHEFPYPSPAGLVRVKVHREGSLLRLVTAPLSADSSSSRIPSPGAASGALSLTPPGVTEARDSALPGIRVGEIADPARTGSETQVLVAGVPVVEVPAAPAPGGSAPLHAPRLATATVSQALPADSGAVQSIVALFQRMVETRCSDLHLSSGNPPLFRKDGEIVRLGDEALLSSERIREMLFSIAPRTSREEFEQRHDTDFAYEVRDVARFRCNLFMDRVGVGGVFRVIPSRIPTVEELGLPKHILQLCRLNKGLVLVTGPTGCGKSTTLASFIDWINNQRTDHIITIEDPIEFVHQNRKCLVNQREVGTHTEGFKQALRAALREDPDIVLVGEMRDLETVAIAIETAETGHLVFATLHTNTAPSTVDRIIDQFPSDRQSQIRTMLSESLKGVISQTLCKRKGGDRVAALEILYVTAAISNLIRESKTFQIPSLMQTNKALGMTLLNDSLLELVHKNLVEPQEAYHRSVAKAEFKSLLDRNGIKIDLV